MYIPLTQQPSPDPCGVAERAAPGADLCVAIASQKQLGAHDKRCV